MPDACVAVAVLLMPGRRRPAVIRATLDAVAEAVLALDGHGRILHLNPAAERLLGPRLIEVVGRSWREALELDGDVCADLLRRAEQRGRTVESPWSFVSMASGERQVAAAATPWPAAGEGAVVVTLRPLDECDPVNARVVASERLAAASRRRQERKADEARHAEILQAIAGGVAHRFNNLLAAILGQAENAQCILDADRHELATCLDGIVAASLEAGRLVRSFAAGLGVTQPVLGAVDLRELVDCAVVEAGRAAGANRGVVVHHADNLPAAYGDAASLTEVAGALIANAAEAVTVDGVVTVRTSVAETGGGRRVLLEVADDGCGMDAETQRRMFDPFFSTKFIGRGLGLAVARAVVLRHGGSIVVTTRPGAGTVVTVSLPVARDQAPRPRLVARTGDWRGDGLVLLVEDEKAVREAISAALTGLGFEVLAASDGDEALAHHARAGARLRCVVLDVALPHQGGELTLRRLRDRGLAAPVILCSGHDEETLARRFTGAEIAAILAKPFTASQLGATLRRALAEPAPGGHGDEPYQPAG